MNSSVEQLIDEILVLDCQSGRVKALEILVSRWQQRLWRYVYNLTGDADAAWDITQESWLGIIKGLRKLQDPARFRAWAYRIVTNKVANWLRDKNRHKHVEIEAASSDGGQEKDDSELKELVYKLKNDSRMVLSLYYFEQLTVGEVSDVLNIPRGTVKSRLFKAREELKKLWDKYVGD